MHGDDAGSHSNQNTDEDHSDQNHLFGVVLCRAVTALDLDVLIRQQLCAAEAHVQYAAHQQGQADLGVLEEAELPQAHILQDAVCHDVGGGAHQRDGAAQRGEECQSHQQLGLLDASLGGHGADDGHQTGSGAGIVQECGQAAGHKAGTQQQALFGLAQQTDDLAADKVGQTGLEEGLANDHQTHEEHDGGVAELGVGAASIDNAGGGQCCGDGCAEDDQRDLLRDQQDHGDHKDDAGNDRLCCHNSDTSKMNCTICAVVF